MASRRDYFYDQQVTDAELDAGFAGLEQADFNQFVDLGLVGIAAGLTVVEHSPTPDLTVDVAIGTGYDQQGRRLRVPSLQVLSLSVDSNSVSTAVANPGQSKIVGVFLRFKRTTSDPRTDGNGAPVNFVQEEGFEFVVVQGAEAVSPTAPTLLVDGILLADVTRTFGQTQIVNANISTARRAFMFDLTVGLVSIEAGTFEEALQDLLTELNNHVDGTANKHAAAVIDYAGGVAWADGTTNPATTVELQLDKLLSELASTSGSGADKIGCKARTNWLGGRTNPAGTLFAAIDKIITDLAATDTGDDGAERIGVAARTGSQGATSFPTEGLGVRLGRLQDGNIEMTPKTWTRSSQAIAAAALNSQITQIISDLSSQAATDGASQVGCQNVAQSPTSYASGSVRSQLTEALTAINARARIASAETINGDWTVTGDWVGPRFAKAWGTITLDGAGNATLNDSVGTTSVAVTSGASGYVTVTIPARPDINYACNAWDATQNSSTERRARSTYRTTTTFRIYWYDAAGAILDPAATSGVVQFSLFDNA